MPHIPGEPDELMTEIQRAKQLREGKVIRRVDPQQPAFSPHSETVRQAQAVTEANKRGDEQPINLDEPVNLDSPVNLDEPSIPGLRQGSTADVQVQKPTREMSPTELLNRQTSTVPYASESSVLGVLNKGLGHVGETVGDLGATYEKYIGKPFREMNFKRDPLETLAEQTPGNDATLGQALWHKVRTLGTAVLADPMTALVPPSISGLGRARPRPGPSTPPESPVTPAASPVAPNPVSPAPVVRPPVPDITDLAKAAQEQQLLLAQSQAGAGISSTESRAPVPVGQLPTGSLSRGVVPQLSSEYPGPHLQTLPTGSLAQVKPGQVSVEAGRPTEYPLLPSQQEFSPQEVTQFESRRLHGKSPEGPPAPPVKSAEDLLAERLTMRDLQQQSFQEATKDAPELPPVPPDVEKLPGFLQPKFQMRQQKQAERYQSVQQEAQSEKAPFPGSTQGPRSEPHLSPTLRQPEQSSPASSQLSDSMFSTSPTQTQRAPRPLEKVFLQALDVLPKLGPFSSRLRDILHYTRDYSEQGTIHNFLDYTQLVEKLYGKKQLTARWKALAEIPDGTLTEKAHTLLNASAKDWGMTQKEIDALVELHYAQGDLRKVSEYAKSHLPVNDSKVRQLFQDGWQIATGRASSHPAVQKYAQVHDPVTGEATPVGQPTPYWPHQAVNQQVKELLSEDRLRKIYSKGQYKMDFETFKDRFMKWYQDDSPENRLRKFAGFEYKRFFDALDDANSHQRGVADSLRKMGYETDPVRMLVRHNMFALKRAAYLEHEAEIKQLMSQLGVEYGLSSQPYKWIKSIVDRASGISQREDFSRSASNPLHIAQSIAYPAFLKASWKQNFLLQPNYAVLQIGLRPVVESSWKFLGSKLGWSDLQIKAATERSGATFPHFMTSYHMPEGLTDQYAKTMQTLNLFSPSDTLTRRFTALAEGPAMTKISREFWKNPAEPKWRGLLNERNINPTELYTALSQIPKEQWVNGVPPVPQQFINRAMQVSANKAMGRTGIHSLQSWVAVDKDLHQIMLMLHRQIASNEGMLVNSILNAPTAGQGIKRALVFLVGAEAAGAVYQGVVNLLVGNDLLDVNKSLVKTFGGHKEAAFMAKSLLMGIGTFTAGIALTGLEAAGGNKMSPVYSFMSPPIASLVDDTMNKLIRGELKDPLLRLQPSETVATVSRYGEKQKRERERAGGASLPNPLQLP